MRRSRSRRGRFAIAAAMIAALMLLGVLGQRQYVRATTAETWVAANQLPAGYVVKRGDLVLQRVSAAESALALDDPEEIVGRRLAVAKESGTPFTPNDFAAQSRPSMSAMVPEGRVVFAMAPDKYLLPYSRQLRGGDRFDILITTARGNVQPLAYDVILLGMLHDRDRAEKRPRGRGVLTVLASPDQDDADSTKDSYLLVLAVKPEHVVPLASARAADGKISFVVHGQNEVSEGKRLAVIPPKRSVEVYAGLSRTRVTVNR